MLRYDYISKEWIVSPKARTAYRVAAIVSLGLLALLWAAQVDIHLLDPFRPILKVVLLAGVVGAATTLIGMEYFLLRFDNSHPLKQIFWFAVMLFIPLGPALYCFLVYSRSDALKTACAASVERSVGVDRRGNF